MRLLLIDQFGEIGGAQRCLLEAAAGFRERGWELDAAVPARGGLARALAPYCGSVDSIHCGPFQSTQKGFADAARFLMQLPAQAAQIARLVRRRKPDAVYVNGPRMLAAPALGRLGRPLIYHVHWMPPQQSASRLARRILKASRANVIASSRLAAAWVGDAVVANRVFTVYNGVTPGVTPLRSRDQIVRIAVLGRIAPEKGQLEFARAARILSERIRGLDLIVCGSPMFADPSYFEQVRAEAKGAIRFKEWTDDVPSFLAGIDLLVVPSPHDNLPRVIFEAFAARVPVIAFRSGAIPEIIEHGQTGWLLRECTAEALARAIQAAVASPDALQDMAARAYRHWQENFTLQRFQSEVCDAVEAVLRHHQRTPLKSAGAKAAA